MSRHTQQVRRGFNFMLTKIHKGRFIKGFTPWNKGKKTGIIPKSAFSKGHTPWNQDKHFSKKSKKKMSEAHKGIKLSKQHKRKIRQGNKGKIMSEQAKQNMSKAQKGNTNCLGKRHTKKTKQKLSKMRKGEKGSNWKGGISPKNKRIRMSLKFRLWREAVFTRDNWICQKCSERGGKLNPHHIFNFADYPKLRFNINNGITLCEKCHTLFHKIYGKKKNNQQQLNKFLSNHN